MNDEAVGSEVVTLFWTLGGSSTTVSLLKRPNNFLLASLIVEV